MDANLAVTNCYGRVEVDYIDKQGKLATKVFSNTSSRTLPDDLKKLRVGQAVLCRQLSRTEAFQGGYKDRFSVTKVFSPTEEARLCSSGTVFPELPPDLHQQGFYG